MTKTETMEIMIKTEKRMNYQALKLKKNMELRR